jgi:hypothetical protein
MSSIHNPSAEYPLILYINGVDTVDGHRLAGWVDAERVRRCIPVTDSSTAMSPLVGNRRTTLYIRSEKFTEEPRTIASVFETPGRAEQSVSGEATRTGRRRED